MGKIKRNIIIISLLTTLTSCDAYLILSYNVQNKTDKPIIIKIDNYTTRLWAAPTDTTIELKPNDRVTVGYGHDLGLFHWDTKKIYKSRPGLQNFKIIMGDSTFSVDSRDEHWTYKRRTSNFKIKNRHVQQRTISKKEAIEIAKKDTISKIAKIKSSELLTDSASNILCWIIEEKINVEREYKKIRRSKKGGMTFVNANRIKINANTGEIISREKIKLGSIHIRGKW